MTKLFSFVSMFLLVPVLCRADTLVTWASDGVITLSHYHNMQNTGFVPPPGTPYQMTMSFDPGTTKPSFGAPAGSNCFSVSVAGQISIGGADYGLSGSGFTHAQLPGTNCTAGSPETQFLLGLSNSPVDNPWPALRPGAFMELWYTDALMRDAFPAVPTSLGGGFQIREQLGSFLVMGDRNLRAVPEQPTPVPEPGTMALVGLGLAAAVRRARAARRG